MNIGMNPESDARHVTDLLPDYVLDLLAHEEQRLVSSHLSVCHQCRLAARRERQLVLAVRDTFSAATQPDSKRLYALRPAMSHSRSSLLPVWQKPLAATLLLLLVILGSLALQSRRSEAIWPAASPGVFAVTASVNDTVTDTPTLAATSTATEMAPQSSAPPTPKPDRAPDRAPDSAPVSAAVRAVLSPRPAVAPVAVSPFFK